MILRRLWRPCRSVATAGMLLRTSNGPNAALRGSTKRSNARARDGGHPAVAGKLLRPPGRRPRGRRGAESARSPLATKDSS